MRFKKRSQIAYMYCQHINFENYLRMDNSLIPEWTNTKNALKQKLAIDSLTGLDRPGNIDLINRYDRLIRSYHSYHMDNSIKAHEDNRNGDI